MDNYPPIRKISPRNNVFIRALRERMVASGEMTPEEYVAHLPEDQRKAVQAEAEGIRERSLNDMLRNCGRFETVVNYFQPEAQSTTP